MKEPASPTLPDFKETNRERSAKRLMWLGVISFSVIIAVLWGWSLAVQMSEFQLKRAPEYTLASKTKQEWSELFAKQKEDRNSREATLQQIRDAIKGLGALTATSTGQTTSTLTATSSVK